MTKGAVGFFVIRCGEVVSRQSAEVREPTMAQECRHTVKLSDGREQGGP